MTPDELRYLLQRPIAFHRVFADLAGGATGGLFLSQLFYWSDKGSDPDGWIYKTQAEWQEETALTRWEQERARKVLRELGILEEQRRDVPARLYYRLNVDALASMLNHALKDEGSPRASVRDTTGKDVQSRNHYHTETTAEMTNGDAANSIDRMRRAVRGSLGRR